MILSWQKCQAWEKRFWGRGGLLVEPSDERT